MAKNKKVIVAMSGGVDSSVAAALLKRQGFDVIGVHMKFWSDGDKTGNRCCTPESEKRARLVAKKIGIPFYVLNFNNDFKKAVVDYFLKENKKGNTPNPCVVCNKEIKFGLLLGKAIALGADYVATGHYAKLATKYEKGTNIRKKEFKLLKGKDENKDQSYFLWKLDQKQLSHILFPVGGYTKPEVRQLAKKFELPTAETPESQEVCFIQDTTNNFLKKYLKKNPGNIVDRQGKILGRHEGLYNYTIGQRKGIGFSGGPYYVLAKDIKKNNLIVTKDENDLYEKELKVKNINWISDKPTLPLRVNAKIRYRSKEAPAVLYKDKLVFNKPQRAITPGQSVVFYKGKELIGGGIIL